MFAFASLGAETGATSIVGPSNAMYVDVAGNDDTGTRGNAARPFLTIAAAMAAQVTDYDEVCIGPGAFAPAAALSIKAGQKGLNIRGSGVEATFIVPAAGINAFDLSTAGATQFSMADLTINCTGAGKCIYALGASTAFMSSIMGVLIERVQMSVAAAATNAIDFSYVGVSLFRDCAITTGSVLLTTCGAIVFRGTTQSGTSFITTWDNTDALKPAAGQGRTSFLDASAMISTVALTGQARLTVDSSSSVGNLTGLNMSVAAGPVSPAISFQGTAGTIDFGSTGAKILPNSALGAYTVDFSGCTITGASAEFETITTALTVNMTGFVSTGAAFVLTAGVQANIVCRGSAIRALVPATTFATPDASGSITPDRLTGLVDISAGGALVKTWANLGYTALVRVGTAVFDAQVTSIVQAADAVVPSAGKAVTGLTITSTAAVNNNAANVLVSF